MEIEELELPFKCGAGDSDVSTRASHESIREKGQRINLIIRTMRWEAKYKTAEGVLEEMSAALSVALMLSMSKPLKDDPLPKPLKDDPLPIEEQRCNIDFVKSTSRNARISL